VLHTTVYGEVPALCVSYSRVCSVLQCVAVCCSVLPCVAMCCNVLQCVARIVACAECLSCACLVAKVAGYCIQQYMRCVFNVLQCVAVCCNVLQCVAVCCIQQYLRCACHAVVFGKCLHRASPLHCVSLAVARSLYRVRGYIVALRRRKFSKVSSLPMFLDNITI